jgi:hypothetical protein
LHWSNADRKEAETGKPLIPQKQSFVQLRGEKIKPLRGFTQQASKMPTALHETVVLEV